MPIKDRKTLKHYFERGKKPSEQAFADLIDSSLNTLDDGFIGSPTIGIGLTPMNEDGVIISAFANEYENNQEKKPLWQIALDKKTGNLEFRRCKNKDTDLVMTMKYETSENTNTQISTPEIYINGLINYQGRKGSYITGEVPADGQWHDMLGETADLQPGCWAFEVVAGCGEPNSGKHALLVATAMHCFGSQAKIKKVRSNFGQWGNRICLRWVKIKDSFTCQLQIKTFFKYSEGSNIEYQISKLWDNTSMK